MYLIFHLNVLADPAMIRAHTQVGIARMLGEIYGDEQAWFSAYHEILADWDSYHADLNFSGDDGMADMREARFRIMRALFRIMSKPDPSQEEIHALADEALVKAHDSESFFYASHNLLMNLAKTHSISLVSYFPQVQLEAFVKTSLIKGKIQHFIGADTFEQYDMNQRYFEILVNRLQAKPENCIYIDKQEQVLEAAAQVGIKTFFANPTQHSRIFSQELKNFIAKEFS